MSLWVFFSYLNTSSVISIITIIFRLKIIAVRSQFLVYLLTIEVFIILGYTIILFKRRAWGISSMYVFVFIIVIVIGAVIGMRIVVGASRSSSKQIELIIIKG